MAKAPRLLCQVPNVVAKDTHTSLFIIRYLSFDIPLLITLPPAPSLPGEGVRVLPAVVVVFFFSFPSFYLEPVLQLKAFEYFGDDIGNLG